MRWISFSGGVILGVCAGGVAGLVFGGILGVIGGDINANIDFCGDDGSRRYIHDDAARHASCE